MNEAEFFQKYGKELNEQQVKAVRSVKGPVLLLAVPGSGKTHVLTLRLGYMVLCQNIDPSSIVVMTYTNAAVREMKQRYGKWFGEGSEKIRFCTINSLASSIIRTYERMSGHANIYELADDQEIHRILTGIYRKVHEDYPSENDIRALQISITFVKNRMVEGDSLQNVSEDPHFEEIYQEYTSQMKKLHRMDFDDQLVFAYTFLQKVQPLREWYQNQYQYYCVDEAQDTSLIQHKIIALLAEKSQNLFMVGDEDQSIYGFRAAYPQALTDFEKNRNHAKVLTMETNYRSDGYIVQAADAFVQKNRDRHPKHMKASRPSEDRVHVIHLQKRMDQYALLLAEAYYNKEETAVLFRNNDSAVELVDMLDRKGIPWRYRNQDSLFFTNRIVVDLKDILTFSLTEDPDIFEHIYYRFSIGLKKEIVQKACRNARLKHSSVLQEIQKDPAAEGVKTAVKKLQSQLRKAAESSAEGALEIVWNVTGYQNYAQKQGFDESKVEILEQIAENCTDVSSFLKRLEQLQSIIADHKNDPSCPFILSTIHSAKGLEFKRVFLLDVIDGTLPAGKEEDEENAYEEERRLYYVGMTRAEKQLFLFDIDEESSAFVQEVKQSLPQETFAPDDFSALFSQNLIGRKYYDKDGKAWNILAQSEEKVLLEDERGYVYFDDAPNLLKKRKKTYSLMKREKTQKLQKGMKIDHIFFGEGVVLQVHHGTARVKFADKQRTISIQSCLQKHLVEVL